MADNTNNTDTGSISKMDDTRTRKTLKLKPVKKSGLNAAVDPLTQRNTETGPLGVMADTRTRKTVKLKSVAKGGLSIEDINKNDLKPVVDPLTQRNTETGPLGPMVDTRTRKTVKLKSLKPKMPPVNIDVSAASGEGGMLKETHTRKTLKLKPVKPETAPPLMPVDSAGGGDGTLKETHTRKTLKLKPISDPGAEKTKVSDDDTIKIQRPKQKSGAKPMPSLGVTAAAKTVNNKDTVKLRPPATGEALAAEEVSKASKDTIKLSPHPAPEEAAKAQNDNAPTVNLKVNKKPKKSKLTIGKTPPPKTPVTETPAPKAPAGKYEASKPNSSGLKLKDMAPIAEAPRAQADKDIIKKKKRDRKGGKNQTSGIYTLLAVLTVVLMAFSAAITTIQYFNLWDLKTIGGQKIEIPYLNELIK